MYLVVFALAGCASTSALLKHSVGEHDVVIGGSIVRNGFQIDVSGKGERQIDPWASVPFRPSAILMPAGECQLDIFCGGGARLNEWHVVLAGGKSYVVRGQLCSDAVEVWIEEYASGTRVSEVVSIALFD
jgi:hypothetical protein